MIVIIKTHFLKMNICNKVKWYFLMFFCVISLSECRDTFFPKILENRRVKRESRQGQDIKVGDFINCRELFLFYPKIQIEIQSKPLHILLSENDGLELKNGIIEWIHPNGSKSMEAISSILGAKIQNHSQNMDSGACFFRGFVDGDPSSLGKAFSMPDHKKALILSVAVNLCDGVRGIIRADGDGYLIEPVVGQYVHVESEHVIVRVSHGAQKDMTSLKRMRQKRDIVGGILIF